MCQVIDSIQISAQEDFTHVSILIEGNLFRKKTYNEQKKRKKKNFESCRTNSNDFRFVLDNTVWLVNFPMDKIDISERSFNWKH